MCLTHFRGPYTQAPSFGWVHVHSHHHRKARRVCLANEGRGKVVPLSASARVEPQGFGSPAGREDESERSTSPLRVSKNGNPVCLFVWFGGQRSANDLANVKDKLIEGGSWSNSAVPFFLTSKTILRWAH